MANQVRILQVMTGSNVVHQLLDDGSVEFNRNAVGGGAFSVSGSVNLGPEVSATTPNNIASGSFVAGLLQIPSVISSNDAAFLTALVGSGLAAGDYNGQMFYMSGSGLTSGDATAVSYFSRGDCLYFCRNGKWFSDFWSANKTPASEEEGDADNFSAVISFLLSFENGQGWNGTTASPDATSHTFSASTTSNLTYETSTGFDKTFSDVDLSSFSGTWNTSTESLGFEAADGYSGTAINAAGHTFSASTTSALTYEASTGFDKTFSDVDLSSFSATWSTSTESLGFEAADGFTGTAINAAGHTFSASTTSTLTYEASTGFDKTFSDVDLSSFSASWNTNDFTDDPGNWS